jgi:hypothetical protein
MADLCVARPTMIRFLGRLENVHNAATEENVELGTCPPARSRAM